MKRLIISVKTGPTSNIYDLDVPGDQPLGVLVNHIAEALELPANNLDGKKLYYWCANQYGAMIDEADTLISAGIKNSDLILIDCGTSQPPKWQKIANAPGNNGSISTQAKSTDGQVAGTVIEDIQQKKSGNDRQVPSSDIPDGWTKLA
jgi:hypothetical protein